MSEKDQIENEIAHIRWRLETGNPALRDELRRQWAWQCHRWWTLFRPLCVK